MQNESRRPSSHSCQTRTIKQRKRQKKKRGTWALTEVDDVDDVLALAQANKEVVRLYVTVDEALCVNILQSAQQLRRSFVETDRKKTRQQPHDSID